MPTLANNSWIKHQKKGFNLWGGASATRRNTRRRNTRRRRRNTRRNTRRHNNRR